MTANLRRLFKASILLPVLGMLALLCALHGWVVLGVRPLDAVFLAIEALKLGSEYRKSDGWNGNLWLEAARLFGLTFYLVTLWKAFGFLLRAQASDLRAQVSRRDLVCIGDHPVLSSIVTVAADHGRSVLWFSGDDGAPAIARARIVGRPWSAAMVRQFRLGRARTCVVAFRDDLVALDVTLQLRAGFAGPITILPSTADTAEALRALNGPNSSIRVAPVALLVARALHVQHPPFLAPRAPEQRRLDVLIVGSGDMARAIMVDLLLASLTVFLDPPRITFLAHDAARLAAAHADRMPELGKSAELRYVEMTFGADEAPGLATFTGLEGSFTNIYVCLDVDHRSLSAAASLNRVALQRQWSAETVFVHQHRGGSVWRSASDAQRFGRLTPFGDADGLARGLGLVDIADDSDARSLHRAHRAIAAADVPANVPWEELPEDLREANRRQAMHLPAKLASAGVDIRPWIDAVRAGDRDAPPPAFPDLARSPGLLHDLAKLEHERWMVERRISGWRVGVDRDDQRLVHPDLVDFHSLSERSRSYDVDVIHGLAGTRPDHRQAPAMENAA